ncbi:MAG: hypothetical protein ABIU05_23510 [Nitrospirales bacterium]
MTSPEIERKAQEDGLLRGFHDIPDDVKLHKMSFVELVALLTTCEEGSVKFHVVERELKKRLAKDQAKINRKNIFLGACLGGIFGLVSGFLVAHLKDSPSSQQLITPTAVQQPNNANLAVKSTVGNIEPNPSFGTPLTSKQASAQGNAKPHNAKP